MQFVKFRSPALRVIRSTVTHLPRPEGISATVAAEVRSLLGRYNRTQTDLAMAIGLTQSQLSKRLRGTIVFDLEELARVADYFGTTIPRLLGYENAPQPSGPGGGSEERAWRYSKPQPSDPKVRPLLIAA